jgi:hypothetical protein
MSYLPPQSSVLFNVECVRKIAKCAVLLMALLLSPATVSADVDDQWTNSCVAGLETNGGRGSNAAGAYCACMAKAAGQFSGEPAGLLAVMQAPVAQKTALYNKQNNTNKRIISACAVRVEEVYGVVEKKNAAGNDQPIGVWADPQVLDAIRAINLNASQAKIFRASATKYGDDLRAATAKIFRDRLDIKRKMKKKQRVLAKRMDDEIMASLNNEQVSAYQTFTTLLSDKVKALGRKKPGATSVEKKSSETTKN